MKLLPLLLIPLALLSAGLSGCAGVSGAAADINKVIDSLPPGSVGMIDVGHHDIYGNGGVVLTNAVKASTGAASVQSVVWEENYPLYQPHAVLKNFVRLGKNGELPPPATVAPPLISVPLTSGLQFQASIAPVEQPAPAAASAPPKS